ncbi:hypothetical protein [Raineya sp.]
MFGTLFRLSAYLLPFAVGIFAGYFAKEQFFTKPCPACVCPECPPSNITYLVINNEKLKVKGNGSLDLTNILKDNQIKQENKELNEKDTLKQKPERKGFFKRIFGKK